MLITAIEWGLSIVFLTTLTLLAWHHFRGLGCALDSLSFLFLHTLLTSSLVMVTGILGVFKAHWLTGISLIGLMTIGPWKHKQLASDLGALCRPFRPILLFMRRHPIHAAAYALVLGMIGLRMGLHIWYFPPFVWDTLTYHLPKVAEWVQHGNLHVPNLPVKRVFWPGGFELLQAWWAIFPHRDVIVEAPGLLFYAMACISVYVVCRQLEISRKAAAWSMVVFGLTPVMALSAVSCKNDVAITAFTLYLTALWCRPQPVEAAWKRWVLSCAIICMGIGIKPTLCFILPGILVLAHLGIRRSDFRVLLCPPLIGWMGGVLLLGCLLGGYWYLRNWVWFDNAFYPVSFGGQAGQPQQGSFSWASGFESIRALAVDKIFDGELRDPDVNGTTGWGWFAFVCGWPAVLYGVFTDRKYRWIVAGYLISFLSLMCWISSDPWNMRFVSWMPALGVWGFFVARRQLVPFVRYILVALAAWTTALNGFASAISSGVKLDFQSHYTDRVWNPAFHWFLAKHVPVGEKLAIFGGGDDWVYLVYGPSFERMVCYLEAPVGKGFTDVMKEKNLKYLCRVPSGHRLPEPEWVKDDLQQGRIIEIGRGLYRLAEDNGRENDER